jgi:glycogen debranching enzyme
MAQLAALVQKSFNARFWNVQTGCCYDVIDDHGADPSIRPNQLLAVSLTFAVLSPDRHAAVLERIGRDLLTPVGLRTLSPHDPGYHGCYGGEVVARERAVHNGCVHPWLLGQYGTAHVRLFGRSAKMRDDAREMLRGCVDYIRGHGLGNLCELFDGDAPHQGGGAIASAASVGELLRCYVEDVLDLGPAARTSVQKTTVELPISVAPKAQSKR